MIPISGYISCQILDHGDVDHNWQSVFECNSSDAYSYGTKIRSSQGAGENNWEIKINMGKHFSLDPYPRIFLLVCYTGNEVSVGKTL